MKIKKRIFVESLALVYLASGILTYSLHNWLTFVFGLIYSTIIPGCLILMCIKGFIKFNWENTVYLLCLGVSSLMFLGIAESATLRTLGIDRPLSTNYLFMTTFLFGFFLFVRVFKQADKIPIVISRIKFSYYDCSAILISLILLLGLIGGAFRLNNGTSGWLSTMCYLGAAVSIVWLYLVSSKLKTSSIITSLWLIGLGIILSGWLRSNYAAGPDLDKEFQIFSIVKESGYWSIGLYKNIYTACLSISMLPVVLSLITKMPNLFIYKFVLPLLYSLIVPIVFLVARTRLNKRGSIVTTFFYIAQPAFTIWWWVPMRQDIAFLYFGLIVLLFIKAKKNNASRVLFIILAMSMVVSHYSTTYIAVGLFLGYRIVESVTSYFHKDVNNFVFLKYSYILFLFMVTFLWYSQLTFGFNGATEFISKSVLNIGSLFSSDVQQKGQSPLDSFNLFSKAGTSPVSIFQINENDDKIALKQYGRSALYTNDYLVQQPIYNPTNSALAQKFDEGRNLLKLAGNLWITLGALLVGVIAWLKKPHDRLAYLQLTSIILFAVAVFLPFFSISYGEDRLYQQLLIVFAASMMLSITSITKNNKILKFLEFGALAFVCLYFVFLNNVVYQFTPSSEQAVSMSNSGEQYYEYYINTSDVKAAQWFDKNRNDNLPVYADTFSQYRMISDASLRLLKGLSAGVFPNTLPRESYVYQSSVNTTTQTAFISDEGVLLYQFPTEFLSSHKNTIYNNSSSIIYR